MLTLWKRRFLVSILQGDGVMMSGCLDVRRDRLESIDDLMVGKSTGSLVLVRGGLAWSLGGSGAGLRGTAEVCLNGRGRRVH